MAAVAMAQEGTVQLKRPNALTLSGARLVVQRGPERGRALHVAREEIVVGSGDSADLQLTDPGVSRNHCRLRVQPDGYLLVDLGSTNGTFIDGRRVVSAYLNPGEIIELGESLIRL